jgi:hypothetical protein
MNFELIMQLKRYREKLKRNLFNRICKFIIIFVIKLSKLRKIRDKVEGDIFYNFLLLHR